MRKRESREECSRNHFKKTAYVSVRRAMLSNCINKVKPTPILFHYSKLWLIKGNGVKGYWWK